jgi:hypothetical protein
MAGRKVVPANQQVITDSDDRGERDWPIAGEGRLSVAESRRLLAMQDGHIHLLRADETRNTLLVRSPAHLGPALRQAYRKDGRNPAREFIRGRILAVRKDQEVAFPVYAPLAIGSMAARQERRHPNESHTQRVPAAQR